MTMQREARVDYAKGAGRTKGSPGYLVYRNRSSPQRRRHARKSQDRQPRKRCETCLSRGVPADSNVQSQVRKDRSASGKGLVQQKDDTYRKIQKRGKL